MNILKRIIPILVVAALLTTYFLYERAKVTPDPTRIATSGYIEGHEVRLASLNGGRVAELHVTEGQVVEPGDPIVSFERDSLELKLAELQAMLDAAGSQYRKLLNGPRDEELSAAYQAYLAAESKASRLEDGYREEDIAPLRSQLDGAEASLAKAMHDFERMASLYDQEIISRSEYESAEMVVDVAESNRDALIDQIEQLETGFPDGEIDGARHQAKSLYEQYLALKEGAREEDIDTAGAEIDRLRAGVAQVEEQLSEAMVISSAAGYIRELPLRPGDVVPPGTPVGTLIEDGKLWVKIYVPAHRLGSVSLGQIGYIYPDALIDEKIEATITYISPEGEFTPRNIQTQEDRVGQVFGIKLTISTDDARLKPGMGCEVVIPLNG